MTRVDDLKDLHVGCGSGCWTRRCRRGRCAVSLPKDAGLVDCDQCLSFPNQATRPDFVGLDGMEGTAAARWIVLEFKRQVSDVTHIVEQLQAGAQVLQSDPRFRIEPAPSRFAPVVVREKGRIHAADVVQLSKAAVVFRGQKRPIRTIPCSSRLSEIL